ncbi:MAG: tRNA pseudouridine(38-40) synthase TruA [Chitinophagaceae bacterium]|nr:tRNA pseudouridine(38-40) synthase TruA [Chitinophagaceae bacterium]
MRYFLELSYKGTAYSGFQVQENAPTVQAELERAMQTLFRQSFGLTGSSRTDAGVHALQNFFHFDTELVIENRSVYNLNAILPADISVKGIYEVPADAHCRFSAVAREYKYFIYRDKNPFLDDRAWQYPYPLDLPGLQQAASLLFDYQDYTTFSKRNTQVKTYDCTILASEWIEEGEMLVYQVKANRFLRGMVRGLVGTMLKLGRGQLGLAEFRGIIESRDSSRADFTTPAKGLFLQEVSFPADLAACLVAER